MRSATRAGWFTLAVMLVIAVPTWMLLRLRRDPGEEDLRRRLVRVVLEEVVLGRPVVLEARRRRRPARPRPRAGSASARRRRAACASARRFRTPWRPPSSSRSATRSECLIRGFELPFGLSNCQSNLSTDRVQRRRRGVANRTLQDKARQARNDVYRQHILEAAERGLRRARLRERQAAGHLARWPASRWGRSTPSSRARRSSSAPSSRSAGSELLQVARDGAHSHDDPRAALDGADRGLHRLLHRAPGLPAHAPAPRARRGCSARRWARRAQVELWAEIHALQAEILRRGVAAGVFVDEDPAFLAKIFSALDQVLLADWVAGGMKADARAS